MITIATSARPIDVELQKISTEGWIAKHLGDGVKKQFLSRSERFTIWNPEDWRSSYNAYVDIQQELESQQRGHEFVQPYEPKTVSLFIQSMHEAFAMHQNFSISPEVLWYVIVSEVALHIKLQPDKYRNLYNRNLTQDLIEVRDDSLRRDGGNDWGRTIGLFVPEFKKVLPGDVMGVMLPKFTTLTNESAVALLVAFMDTASSYYHYKVNTMCGIPKIRLIGTLNDWQLLGIHTEELRKMFPGLKSYFERLIPTLRQVILSAHGQIDVEFWESMYKHKMNSGGDLVNGWVTTLLAHWLNRDEKLEPIPGEIIEMDKIPASGFPAHITKVPFVWKYFNQDIPMLFTSGVFGVELVDGFLTPKLGFGVFEKTE